MAPCIWFVLPEEADPLIAWVASPEAVVPEAGGSWVSLSGAERTRYLRQAYLLATGPRAAFEFPPVEWNELRGWVREPSHDMRLGLAILAYDLFSHPDRLADLEIMNRGITARRIGPDSEKYDSTRVQLFPELVRAIWQPYARDAASDSPDAFAFEGT